MTTLLARIDDTRSHLARESASMVSRTRRAGFDLARALRAEADAWRSYLEGRQRQLRGELESLTTPRAAERAILRAADGALEEVRSSIQARLRLVDAELRRARRRKGVAPRRLTSAKKPSARARGRRAVAPATEAEPS